MPRTSFDPESVDGPTLDDLIDATADEIAVADLLESRFGFSAAAARMVAALAPAADVFAERLERLAGELPTDGDALRSIRREQLPDLLGRPVGQSEMSGYLDCSSVHLSRMEHGHRDIDPAYASLARLAVRAASQPVTS